MNDLLRLGLVITLADPPEDVAYGDEPLKEVIRKFDEEHLDSLPVVARENPPGLLGIITYRDAITAYSDHGARRDDQGEDSRS